MADIKELNNREFIQAFQAIDGIIQKNHPIFILLWLGSVIVLIVTTVYGVGYLDMTGRWLLIATTLAYLIGVQLLTFTINIPLNKRLQSLNVDTMDDFAQETARLAFDGYWNRWSAIRTVVSCLVSLLLMVLLLRY